MSRRSEGHSSAFYKKSKHGSRETPSTRSTNKNDGLCFQCQKEGQLARDCHDGKKSPGQQSAKKGKNLFISPTLRQWTSVMTCSSFGGCFWFA